MQYDDIHNEWDLCLHFDLSATTSVDEMHDEEDTADMAALFTSLESAAANKPDASGRALLLRDFDAISKHPQLQIMYQEVRTDKDLSNALRLHYGLLIPPAIIIARAIETLPKPPQYRLWETFGYYDNPAAPLSPIVEESANCFALGLIALEEYNESTPFPPTVSPHLWDIHEQNTKSWIRKHQPPFRIQPFSYVGSLRYTRNTTIEDKKMGLLYIIRLNTDDTMHLGIPSAAVVLRLVRMMRSFTLSELSEHLMRIGAEFQTLTLAKMFQGPGVMFQAGYREAPITLGYRPKGFEGSLEDFKGYWVRLTEFFKNPYVAHSAMRKGGIIWRVAVQVLQDHYPWDQVEHTLDIFC
ncbi:hypothetical protein K474DRAFT_1680915 [Panus rudis PR-1116 ss-1]|nr:hypothetical protein K474DRAFT_1680915 [Panus rudis PR-1116 ss-1]